MSGWMVMSKSKLFLFNISFRFKNLVNICGLFFLLFYLCSRGVKWIDSYYITCDRLSWIWMLHLLDWKFQKNCFFQRKVLQLMRWIHLKRFSIVSILLLESCGHISPFHFKKINWLPVERRVELCSSTTAFKY